MTLQPNYVFFIAPFRKRKFLGERVVAKVLSFGEFYDLALKQSAVWQFHLGVGNAFHKRKVMRL